MTRKKRMTVADGLYDISNQLGELLSDANIPLGVRQRILKTQLDLGHVTANLIKTCDQMLNTLRWGP